MTYIKYGEYFSMYFNVIEQLSFVQITINVKTAVKLTHLVVL